LYPRWLRIERKKKDRTMGPVSRLQMPRTYLRARHCILRRQVVPDSHQGLQQNLISGHIAGGTTMRWGVGSKEEVQLDLQAKKGQIPAIVHASEMDRTDPPKSIMMHHKK